MRYDRTEKDKRFMALTAFSLRDIVKTFPGVRALDGASLEVRAGEVHGLVGENGAGKSTVIKVLAGVYQPDSGTVSVAGRALDAVTPQAVHEAGVRFIHQELHLVPHFTVAESVFMGQEVGGAFGLDRKGMQRRAEAFLRERLKVDIPGDRLIRDLGTAERKLVQIARALIDGKARIVVFDEPTAPLASEETATVLRAIEALKAEGIAILYVSHYLNEINEICDRATVFRLGRDVAVFDTIHEGSGPELVAAMVGRELSHLYPDRAGRTAGEPGLEIAGLSDGASFSDVSFAVRRGEILGIAGLIGSGREELIDTLYGLRRARAGTVRLDGTALRIRSAADAVRAGIVLVPRDRRNDGLVLPMTVAENVTLATLGDTSVAGLVSGGRQRASAEVQIGNLDIRPPHAGAVTRYLSGGNQQKVVLGRWLAKKARAYLFDEPTVGVDVGARSEIYALMHGLARDGAPVLVSSGDPAELVGVCDRILVMMRGRILAEISTEGLSVDRLVAVTTGAVRIGEADDAG